MPLLINGINNLLKLRYFLKNSDAPEDLDAEASAHPEVNKDQDAVATAYTEGPKYLDADTSFLPEVTEYHQVIGTGAIESVNKNKTSDYDIKMDLDVANIDKNNNNAWGTIYEAIDEH